MKQMILSLSLCFFAQGAHAGISSVSKCALVSAPANAPDWKSQAFPLIVTNEGYEASTSMASSVFELSGVDPADLVGWPNYGGHYYKGNNDLWVIISPQEKPLPEGATFRVVKPLETDPNTNSKPANYLCRKSI